MDVKKIETEICVSCGVDTKIPVYLHIDSRHHYIEGAGQLCKECFTKIYETKEIDDTELEK